MYPADRTPNDTLYPQQWYYRNYGLGSDQSLGGISLPRVWQTNTGGGNSVVIAVIDTGILPNHPDIAGSPNLVAGFDMITNTFTANDGDGRDSDPTDPGDAIQPNDCRPGSPARPNSWHGTHVAGTIGVGRTDNNVGVAGVNWNVRVQAVRVLGRCGGSTSDINDAIRWAAGLAVPGVPTNATPASVINLSLGTPPGNPCSASPASQSAIDDAVNQGVTVIVAAGNDETDAAQVTPASCNNVITVAAGDQRGHLATRYSNFGSTVEIMAPGGEVTRDDDNDGNNDGVLSMVQGGYARYNGTSMAAPHVAGVAGLLLAQNPNLTPAQVLQRLQQTAIPRTGAHCAQPCGAGLLSAANALAIELTVAPVEVKEGDEATLTATVRQAGALQSGKVVQFVSSDPSKAGVSPSSATTGTNGVATAKVAATQAGQLEVVASADESSNSVPVTVKVPDVSAVGSMLLFALLAARGARRRRSRPQ